MNSWRTKFIAATVLISAAPAAAQPTNDIQCLLASNLFSRSGKTEQVRNVADANKYYYLGRISARLSEQQIRAQMVPAGKAITAANAGKLMDACNKQMVRTAAEVQAVGKQIAPRKK